MPVAVLIATWSLGVSPVNLKTLGNVSFIVVGVVIASMGEIQFVMIGFLFQAAGIVFEAIRLVMVQRLLSGADFKMDPLVSLYYYAPACAVINGMVLLFTELPKLTMADIDRVGMLTLIANAAVAFLLNVSVVFLVSFLTDVPCPVANNLPDWQNIISCSHPFWRAQGHPACLCFHVPLQGSCYPAPSLRLFHRSGWTHLLQAWWREVARISWPRQHEVAGIWLQPTCASQVDDLHCCHHLHVFAFGFPRTTLRTFVN